MRHTLLAILLAAIGASTVYLSTGCDSSSGLGSGLIPGSDPTAPVNNSGGGAPVDSVGDVFGGGQSSVLPNDGSIRARVRNESDAQADVTLRFIRNGVIVHLAFVRATPGTITTVLSPQMSDQLDLSGVDASGGALQPRTLMYGQDFDMATPAEYVITRAAQPPSSGGETPGPVVPGNPPVADPPTAPVPNVPRAPTIVLHEPASDIALALGSTFTARWTDTADLAGASVVIGLRRVGSSGIVPVSPAVAAGLDGLHDELNIVVQGIQPGTYEVVATINDGVATASSTAAGRVLVEVDPLNIAPTLSILSPASLTTLNVGDELTITWDDADPDGNATITFELVASAGSDLGVGSFVVGPPIAEDPDGPMADRLRVRLDYVLPGLYDLVGTISDGFLVGTARVERAVRLLPVNAPLNDAPLLTLTQPSSDIVVSPGSSLQVSWTDSDANDDARISIMLDPDLFALAPDGDEIVLVAGLSEDLDGSGDTISLGLPHNLIFGAYRIVGTITDGLVQSVSFAPGHVVVSPSAPVGEPGGGNPTALPSVAFVDPTQPVRTRGGRSFGIRLAVDNIPYNADARFFLDNTRLPNGHERIEITPPDFTLLPTTGSLFLSTVLTVPEGAVPNAAWQRAFDLEIVVTINGVQYRSVALAPVWVRQEVEILSAQMINYWCTPLGGGSNSNEPFAGLRIIWRGGGFNDELEVLNPVRFWLSGDGLIPANGANNATHRMIDASQVEGPNQTRITNVSVPNAFGLEYIRVGNYLMMQMALAPGAYHVIPEVHDELFGQLVSPPFGQTIDACFPLPNAGIDLNP